MTSVPLGNLRNRNASARLVLKRAVLIAGVALVALGTAQAMAAYPSRPVRWIVPFSPGGGNDIVSRLLAKDLTEKWHQPFVVDNRPGASTTIGAGILAKAAPNGYTIMLTSATFAMNAAMHRHLPFDPLKDFAPITLVARVPQILLVNPQVPAKTIGEFIALAKREPGKIDFASAGTGSAPYFAMELLMQQTGVSFTHVPYKGTAPALTDVIAGHVQAVFDAVPPALPHVKSGDVRALAVATEHRLGSLPDVPTFRESGLPNFNFSSWFAILAPAGTPVAIIRQLNGELVRLIRHSDVHERLVKMGLEPLGTTPEALGAYVKSQIVQWTQLARAHHLRRD